MPDDHSKLYFTEILFPYLQNWRVVKKDGTEISDGITASYNTSTSGKYTINDIKYDKIRLSVSAPNGLGKQDGIYVKVDLNINDNITEIKWDCHPNQCVEADILAYDYAILNQTVNNLVEQMRLQAEYNKWVASVQKVLSITNTILTLTQLGFSIAGALSTLNMENNSL
ncbi:hypothetical protein M9Y10_031064 [Tritrichomonas musculus]|uniref:GOLD domain-containing protein n=1 Tax=Tritrichomonas musculus TaxID=1915356 RepID=A0ABR2H2Q0_9EUKA